MLHPYMSALLDFIKTEVKEEPLTLYHTWIKGQPFVDGFCFYLPGYGFRLTVRSYEAFDHADKEGILNRYPIHHVIFEWLDGMSRRSKIDNWNRLFQGRWNT
jgi:hypothetical protein